MPQLLPLSRAARLVGISRGALQKRIQDNELQTFEGAVRVSDLLRVFPDVKLQDDSAVERARQIREQAIPKTEDDAALPAPEVLAHRLSSVSGELTSARHELAHYSTLVHALRAQLVKLDDGRLADTVAWLDTQLGALPNVPARKAELMAKDTFLRLIAAHVQFIPSGHDFLVEGNETILNAALRAGLLPHYGCTSGSCGSCKARVVSGQVLKVHDHSYEISRTEQNLGYILMCANTAVTELVLEVNEARKHNDIAVQKIRAEVRHAVPADDELYVLQVATPPDQRLRFFAGQSVRLQLADGSATTLPLASCPCDGQHLEFHVPRHDGDGFADALFQGHLGAGNGIDIEGPWGDFILPEDTHAPLVFLAHDEGFAPIKALIESAVASDQAESFLLIWSVSPGRRHYMDNRCRAWADALDNFRYQPVNDPAALQQNLNIALPDNAILFAAGPSEWLDALAGTVANTQFHQLTTD
ncbi:MAG: 2Fe-2S iron-sulfur cluster binding domain-containing protein [Gammaproteobacteria bacterium]|nr:2Fe-2S iron-sulfur cluster binding domain-containing protein [Gammaproteobacteria bacterium]MCP5136758.1 2Fe-2S iron-sulfur cluster binding domain-containing protein [Gammaproteobacteria bacterium]